MAGAGPRVREDASREVNALTLAQVPERVEEVRALERRTWPEFLLHGDVRGWSALYSTLAEFQTVLLDDAGELAGAALCAPCAWKPGTPLPSSIDEAVFRADAAREEPGAVCALAAIVAPGFQRRGLSRRLLREMVALAREHGRCGVLAPVRPTRKDRHARTPIEEYADERGPDGRLADPWLRVHEELGAARLGFAHTALRVEGSVADWERWTGRSFPESGEYEVDGALVPLRIDRARDRGEYVEPNVWYFHAANAETR